jgi:hypothetical protein
MRLSKLVPAWNCVNATKGIGEDVRVLGLLTAVETTIHIAGYAVNLVTTVLPKL